MEYRIWNTYRNTHSPHWLWSACWRWGVLRCWRYRDTRPCPVCWCVSAPESRPPIQVLRQRTKLFEFTLHKLQATCYKIATSFSTPRRPHSANCHTSFIPCDWFWRAERCSGHQNIVHDKILTFKNFHFYSNKSLINLQTTVIWQVNI